MRCKKYREALIDAAATGGAIEGGLAEHLAHCSQCRAIQQGERALFRAIDGALRGRVNECPSESFLPRIRDRIGHEAQSEAGWNPMWAWAGAACGLLLLAVAHWTLPEQHPVERSMNRVPVHVSQRSVRQTSKATHLVLGSSEMSRKRENVRRHFSAEPSLANESAAREPEVLVPPDEAKAFAQFVARLASGDRMAQAVARPMKDNAGNAELPEIRSVDLAELQLKPQKWWGWDGVSDPE